MGHRIRDWYRRRYSINSSGDTKFVLVSIREIRCTTGNTRSCLERSLISAKNYFQTCCTTSDIELSYLVHKYFFEALDWNSKVPDWKHRHCTCCVESSELCNISKLDICCLVLVNRILLQPFETPQRGTLRWTLLVSPWISSNVESCYCEIDSEVGGLDLS